ncbi:MlaD family protein [Gordonia sp. NB41Y]|uniref:MCE family protein n=1 Tax=Gordonia sp. NB41Y TaxID=875808 RepID=UPI0002BFCAA5|nr:MlaD family protein [Gordonia sp. NB41Y]EMP15177.1 mammalian cell entry protein [Gordonia sp. NB41Y]WLP88808.1 MlaD family protein [Gordonia sp. NB41Y]
MSTMLPGNPVSKFGYIVRAAGALIVIAVFAVWMVGRSTGLTSNDPVIHAEVPVAAGLISPGAPVRYHGVKVGQISSVDAGRDSSEVGMTIEKSVIGSIPAGVIMRVLPRTFFGDIYVQLVPIPGREQGSALSDGDAIAVDSGPDAVNLYDIFSKMSDLIAEVEPEKMTVALAAVNKAIGGRGRDLGVMIDQWAASSRQLEDSVNQFIDATPRFRRVMESLERATPAITETLASVTDISRGIVDHQQNLASFFAAASGYLDTAAPFVAAQKQNLIRVIDSTGKILSTVADNPAGISTTLREADAFAVAGAQVFSTGKFDITAVPTFAQPMPYTAADCPTYGPMRGSQCFGTGSERGVGPVRAPGTGNGTVLNPPRRTPQSPTPTPQAGVAPSAFGGEVSIDGTGEREALRGLEGMVTRNSTTIESTDGQPNPATVMMLGPMVRGAQVSAS